MLGEFGNFETMENSENNEAKGDWKEDENEIDELVSAKWEDVPETQEDADESEVKKLKCKNEDLEGKEHPVTGVPYERKTIVVDGETMEGVFPQFESKFDTKLKEDMYLETDEKQFKYCTQQLKESIEKDPSLGEKFNERQYEQIMDGNARISGYSWHHTENPGEMKLVEADIHRKSGHTGGRSIWGGGSENR